MTGGSRATNSTARRIISLALVAGYPAALMTWYRIHRASSFASIELIVYPLLFGGLGVIAVLLLKSTYLREPLSDFNIGRGTLVNDILWGLILAIACFALFFIAQLTLRDVLAFRPNEELLGLMLDLRSQPWMVLVWFGPVLWIGIALYEEFVRAFLLTGMWSFSQSKLWVAVAIVIVGIFFGLLHWSQGVLRHSNDCHQELGDRRLLSVHTSAFTAGAGARAIRWSAGGRVFVHLPGALNCRFLGNPDRRGLPEPAAA